MGRLHDAGMRHPRLRYFLPIAALILAAFAVTFAACQPKPKPGEGLGSPGIVKCGQKAIAAHAPEALGPVNGCLGGEGDILACLLGLVRPAVGITVDVIGCLTKHEGAAASAAAQANPGDIPDARRAARAREFLEKMGERGWQFAD